MRAMGLLAGLMAGSVIAAGGSPKGVLDGKVFKIETGENGSHDAVADTLTFSHGKLQSRNFREVGFGEGAYLSRMAGGAIAFDADIRAPDGKAHLKGTVKGDLIEGTTLVEKPGEPPMQGWFKGSLARSITP